MRLRVLAIIQRKIPKSTCLLIFVCLNLLFEDVASSHLDKMKVCVHMLFMVI